MEIDEKRLWWALDKIAVKCSADSMRGPDIAEQEYAKAKADAAEEMMEYLERPTPEECRRWYSLGL
jgi:hypothetical protein